MYYYVSLSVGGWGNDDSNYMGDRLYRCVYDRQVPRVNIGVYECASVSMYVT